ncbi:YfhO family protein [Limosilactobacillus reuteri]|uniref:YfhO family protein n=1 Tax=Limosilactobacillus reuteri TaxID=1598 RepID=UPI00128C0A36|nr:YfhO family protein [Limosilactobacillus reuteri]MQB65389.1 hypothetical protein [Limosilactobacillus reuteri]
MGIKKSIMPKKSNYTIAFIVPICLILLIFFVLNIFPFGNKTVSADDMTIQYLSIFTYFKHNLFNIDNLLYTYSLGIGTNFYSVFTYYLLSPINLLTLLFSDQYMPIFFEVNILIDFGLISTTTFFYYQKSPLYKETENKVFWGLVFSISFSLCSYFIIYSISVMWLNAVVLFPIILLYFEKQLFVSDNNVPLYFIFLTLGILTNYYFGFIFLIFLLLYGIFGIIYLIAYRKITKARVKGIVNLIISTLLSISSSLFVILPSFSAQSEVSKVPFSLSIQRMYGIKQLLASSFIGANSGEAPLLGINILCLLGCLYFFCNFKINTKLKSIVLLFLLFLLLTSWVKTPYMIWHAFTLPNGFFQREAFLIVFVICSIAYFAFSQYPIQILSLSTSMIAVALIIWSVSCRFKLISLENLYLNLFLLFFVYILLIFYRYKNKGNLVLLTLIGTFCVALKSWRPVNTLMNLNSYVNVVKTTNEAIRNLKKQDSTFFRMGSNYQINMNDSLAYQYNGVTGYVSQLPDSMLDYLSALGYYQKHQWFRWTQYNNGSTKAVDSLLGVKWILNGNRNLMNKSNKISEFSTQNLATIQYPTKFKENKIQIKKNLTSFSMVIPLASTSLKSVKYDSMSNTFELLNKLFKCIYPNENMYFKNNSGRKKVNSDKIQLTIHCNSNGEAYIYIPTEKNELLPKVNISVNGRKVSNAFGENLNGENGIISLGSFSRGTLLNVELEGKNIGDKRILAYSENEKLLESLSKLSKKSLLFKKERSNLLLVTTNNNFVGKPLAFSIPYDKGWSISIDNKKVKSERYLGGLLGTEVPSGKHTIKLTYKVPYLRVSIIISLLSTIVFAFYVISDNSRRKNKEKDI